MVALELRAEAFGRHVARRVARKSERIRDRRAEQCIAEREQDEP